MFFTKIGIIEYGPSIFMQYFKPDLSMEEYEKNAKIYWKNFDKIKRLLPQKFVDKYCSGLIHDFEIPEIKLNRNDERKYFYDLTIEIKNDDFNGKIIHRNIKEFSNVCKNIDEYSVMEYVYGEFLYEKKEWVHNLFYGHGELRIRCKKIEWVEDLCKPG